MKRKEYEQKLAALNRARDVELRNVYNEAGKLIDKNNAIRSKLLSEEKEMEFRIQATTQIINAMHEEVMACLQYPFEDDPK